MERVNRRVFDFTRFILYSSVQRELVSLTPVVAPSLSKEKEGKRRGGVSLRRRINAARLAFPPFLHSRGKFSNFTVTNDSITGI